MAGMSPSGKRKLRNIHAELTQIMVKMHSMIAFNEDIPAKSLLDLTANMDRQIKRLYEVIDPDHRRSSGKI